jgi:hypothetical protein
MFVKSTGCAVLAAALIGFAVPSSAYANVEAGMLSCKSAGGTGFVIGSVRELACTFQPANGGKPHLYKGVLRRAGLDLGVRTRDIHIAWTVFAPASQVGPGDLAGRYGGVSAGAAVGIGIGGNALFGGLDNSLALQPLSAEGQRGLGVTASVSSLELVAAQPDKQKKHRRHHR